MSLRKQKVGEWLCEMNLISQRQLAEAMEQQRTTGAKVGEILVHMGYLTARELNDVLLLQEVLANQSSLVDYPVSMDVLALLSGSFMKQHQALPLLLIGKRLVLAMPDRNNHEVVELAGLMTGHMIMPLAFRHTDIQDAITFFVDGVRPSPRDPGAPTAPPEGQTFLRKQRLGDWLNDLNLISKRQLAEAMEIQGQTGQKLGAILVEMGYLTDRELSDTLQLQQVLATHSTLTDFPIPPDVLTILNAQFAKQHCVLPLDKIGQRLVLAVTDEKNSDLIDRTQLLTGSSIVALPFRKEDILAAISFFYDKGGVPDAAGGKDRVKELVQAANVEGETRAKQVITELNTDADSTNVAIVNSVLAEAIDSGVSDIHIESTERGLDVRTRLDGVMTKTAELPAALAGPFIARIKILASMNMTENRRPQDGRFTMRHQGQNYDFRVSSIASHWGETVVIRILRPMASSGGLSNLGCDQNTLKKLSSLLGAPSGMVLVTGPTGSGKSSTLYACVGEMDRETDSIVTIEDPVEFPLEGIVQIQVQSKIGVTFAAALRTILRQDPDTVMLGEIRDGETLEAAVAAAMTGHLVLSTLHTNDAISTISRMLDMGAKPFQISSTLVGIVAQRLVRRVCKGCAETYRASAEEVEFLGADPTEGLTLSKGQGCEKCKGTGYKGRVGVYEILQVNRRLRHLINSGAHESEIWSAAREADFHTLLEDGKLKAKQHFTTVEEVIRVLGDGSLD